MIETKTLLKARTKLFRFCTGYFTTAIAGLGLLLNGAGQSVLFAGLAHFQNFVCETENSPTYFSLNAGLDHFQNCVCQTENSPVLEVVLNAGLVAQFCQCEKPLR